MFFSLLPSTFFLGRPHALYSDIFGLVQYYFSLKYTLCVHNHRCVKHCTSQYLCFIIIIDLFRVQTEYGSGLMTAAVDGVSTALTTMQPSMKPTVKEKAMSGK